MDTKLYAVDLRVLVREEGASDAAILAQDAVRDAAILEVQLAEVAALPDEIEALTPPGPTRAQVAALADALWQLLNDMGPDGLSVCSAARAQARVAYEPFRDEPEADLGIMPLADAKAQLAGLEAERQRPGAALSPADPAPDRAPVLGRPLDGGAAI